MPTTGVSILSEAEPRAARAWRIVASVSGGLAVIAGAVGAHVVAEAPLAKLAETASYYQLIHAAVLLWLARMERRGLRGARWLFLAGTLFFCGTLYLKAFGVSSGAVALAPTGGICFILGWFVMAIDACL